MTKLVASKTSPPIGALVTAKAVSGKLSVAISWGQDTCLTTEGGSLGATTSAGSARCLARLTQSLYGSTILEQTEVDHWLTFSLGPLSCESELAKAVPYLDTVLQPATWLVGDTVSIADYEMFSSLVNSSTWLWMVAQSQAPASLLRWFKMMSARPEVASVMSSLPEESKAKAAAPQSKAKEKKEESTGGKFVELPGAKMGEVVVRFPPEASGFLHVGHAKAALLNNYYKESFQGKLIMRFDDTNPAKEKEEYEEVILEDLKMLQVRYDYFSRTSDHFETILKYCDKLLKEGKAYVDDTDAETMKIERDAMTKSKNWDNSPQKNMAMWEEMKKGSEAGTKCAVRAKINMESLNGCLRDPTIYRCKPEPHPSTGTKFKVYPTYDFACPIVDSVEGVTHALRTTEYMDRDDQFNWFIDALGLRKPHIWAYARLNLTNTVMSKRKLTWLVEEGAVDGWDDPRLPTVRGVIRRGLTVEALKQFIIAQGSSRSVVFMEWDKIWAFNKKVLDPIVARHTTVDQVYNVPVLVAGAKLSSHMSAKHPKNPDVGEKTVWTGPRLIIDGADAEQLKEGENATFINWGNLMIKKVNKKDGKVISVDAEQNTDNKDFKKTLKVTWLCDEQEKSPSAPAILVYYDHIISKAILDKDDDFKNFVVPSSKHEFEMLGDPELKSLKKGDMIQVQRRGYFICDVEYRPYNPCVGRARPVVLISIPDGSVGSYGAPGKAQPAKGGPEKKTPAKEGKKQGAAPTPVKQGKAASQAAAAAGSGSGDKLNASVTAQGELIRKLKADKAGKPEIDEAVKKLLALKAEFKSATGQDWKPGMTIAKAAPAGGSAEAINVATAAQGDLVRKLKTEKAAKPEVDEAVKKLLALKAEYKAATGSDWKPGAASATAAPAGGSAEAISAATAAQGDLVRKLKTEKAAKPEVDEAVKKLLALKAEYKAATGSDWKPGAAPAPAAAAPAGRSAEAINAATAVQGDLVRKLKTEKAAKPEIDEAVKKLLALKAEYKAATGSDWKPGAAPAPAAAAPAGGAGDAINAATAAQGDLVRKLKSEKAAKPDVDAAVKKLLALKAEYKAATGSDWKPAAAPAPAAAAPACGALGSAVAAQGELVRKLKTEKAAKPDIDEAVKKLLALKGEYKAATGSDWKPGAAPAPAKQPSPAKESAGQKDGPNSELSAKVDAQGGLVRQLKGDKKPKEEIDAAVKQLLALKSEFKAATGTDWQPAGGAAKKPEKQKKAAKEVKPKEKPKAPEAGVTRLGLEVLKEENLADWYSQVLTKAEMLEYYDVSGCYILRPWSYSIWESIKDFFDAEIKKLGVTNCYFPIFVSQAALEREKEHIADFAPEVAWVTKSGDSDLAEPIAIRPTSETVMYPAYAKWIQSHRDLPIKLNQWNNVVRWEFKHPQPFLRTREFLWQEGHTAFATFPEAKEEVMTILDLYRRVYEELLAIPVVRGKKTEKEKFAGGDYTTTVEAYISAAGRAIQGATSHHLGQNFSKMFDITFESPQTGEKEFVYQNSWGITTRTIGVLVMVHGDNNGLVLPPRVACLQVVIVPCGITNNLKDEDRDALYKECELYEKELKEAGVRVKADLRENYSPGWKYNHWELKGVPIRVEVGPRDMKNSQYVAVRRDNLEKLTMKKSGLKDDIPALLETIQTTMFAKAKNEMNERVKVVTKFEDFLDGLENKCLLQAPFCGVEDCEDQIKELSKKDSDLEPNAPSMGAKSLCIPFTQPAQVVDTDKCIRPGCCNKPLFYTMFGRSY